MSSSMPIEWHKQNLFNTKATIAKEFKRYKELGQKIQRMEQEASFLQRQIHTAEKEGKLKFDQDKYLKRRTKK